MRGQQQQGRHASQVESTTGNQLIKQSHYPVVSEPGGEYVTHITPEDGTGHALSDNLVTVVRE